MANIHRYLVSVTWAGNLGSGTSGYRGYRRDHVIKVAGKPEILASSDPVFRGDAGRYNPEELLLASLSSCHMLWFLHLCADNGIVVMGYEDNPVGEMEIREDGSGRFTEAVLRPKVSLKDESDRPKLGEIHKKASKSCFIANSVNFPVMHQPEDGQSNH